ncbi:MAG: hypothetical protein LUQ28_15890 [Methylococcaceae bacterium]|nr:hypothetical protein [Methylococcaceae bacterium]
MPLNATTWSTKTKDGFRQDIKTGLANAGMTDGYLQVFVSTALRAMVYASNNILPEFEGSLKDYNEACSGLPAADSVYKTQSRPANDENVGKGAAKEANEKKSPSAPVVLTTEQMVAELRRVAGMLGWLDEIDSIIAIHTVEKLEALVKPKKANEQEGIRKVTRVYLFYVLLCR